LIWHCDVIFWCLKSCGNILKVSSQLQGKYVRGDSSENGLAVGHNVCVCMCVYIYRHRYNNDNNNNIIIMITIIWSIHVQRGRILLIFRKDWTGGSPFPPNL
jgi:hypothetical protein